MVTCCENHDDTVTCFMGGLFPESDQIEKSSLKRMKRPDFLFTSGFQQQISRPVKPRIWGCTALELATLLFQDDVFVYFFVFLAPIMRMHFTRTGNIAFPRESCRHNLTSDNCTRKRNVTLSPRLTLTPVQFFFSISLLHQSQARSLET